MAIEYSFSDQTAGINYSDLMDMLDAGHGVMARTARLAKQKVRTALGELRCEGHGCQCLYVVVALRAVEDGLPSVDAEVKACCEDMSTRAQRALAVEGIRFDAVEEHWIRTGVWTIE